MAKLILDTVAGGYDLSVINNNFNKIETAMENTLSRDGTAPNTLEDDLDVNNKTLYNVASLATNSLTLAGQTVTLSTLNVAGIDEILNYAALRAYAGSEVTFLVKGHTAALDGGGGVFRYDPTDTTSADNGGTILVDVSGRRWKRESNAEVHIRWFGADPTGVSDSSAAIQSAINFAAASHQYRVLIPGGLFLATNLTLPSGVQLIGSGWRRTVGLVTDGSRLRNSSAATPLIVAAGTSILSGGPMITDIKIQDLRLEGNGLDQDIVNLSAVAVARFERVFFTGSLRSGLNAVELFDSRFTDCRWEFCGDAAGTYPQTLLRSGGGFEFTNQIHFNSCVWESAVGRDVDTNGANVNEIYFTACKLESGASNISRMRFNGTNGIHFNLTQFASKGAAGNTIAAQLEFTSCTLITGTTHHEHLSGGAGLTNYINFGATSRQVDMVCMPYRGSVMPTTGYAATHGGGINTGREVRFSCASEEVAGLDKDGVAVRGGGTGYRFSAKSGEVALEISRDDIAGETWSLGRIAVDGAGSKFRLFHNATEIAFIGNDNALRWNGGALVVGSAYNASNIFRMGAYYLWVDAAGKLRINNGLPGTDTAGVVVGTQV